MKYWENGFYLEQNKENSRVEITDEEWQSLLNEQTNGKEIVTGENGRPVAIEHIANDEEKRQFRIRELSDLLEKTDYIVTKLAEMQITNNENFSSELARYQQTIQNRVAWRSELNRLLNE